jgi:hypothetical protein
MNKDSEIFTFYMNIYILLIYYNFMVYTTKPVVIFIISIFILTVGGNFMHISNVFAQVITSGEEESVVYMQLSDILDNTQKDLDDLIQAINSGEKDNALNIISNITTNIKEIEHGLDLIVNNPIYGGD